jgi:hypothetical protein
MPSVSPKTSPEAQNMKTEARAHGTAENESESAKYEKLNPEPLVPPKTSPSAQDMKAGPDVVVNHYVAN